MASPSALAFGGISPASAVLPGYFDDIALQADWYTGDCVFEQPGEPKSPISTGRRAIAQDGDDIVSHDRDAFGADRETFAFPGRHPASISTTFHWPQWGKGRCAPGHIPYFRLRAETAGARTQNGGFAPEHFALHGAIRSARRCRSRFRRCGIGMTEGWRIPTTVAHGARGGRSRDGAALACSRTPDWRQRFRQWRCPCWNSTIRAALPPIANPPGALPFRGRL